MNKTIKLAKEANEAFRNYISNNQYDLSVCEKICSYIQNIENLNSKEALELDEFINENMFIEVHLANVYILSKPSDVFNKRVKRMIPLKTSSDNKRIYEARGLKFNKSKTNEEIKVKIKRKTYAKA